MSKFSESIAICGIMAAGAVVGEVHKTICDTIIKLLGTDPDWRKKQRDALIKAEAYERADRLDLAIKEMKDAGYSISIDGKTI